jgi:UDP-glucose 4-epimerase
MKAIVTGGAGFIGSHLVEALTLRGDSVTVFDNLSTGSLSNLQHLDGSYTFVEGDIRDPEAVKNALQGGVDVIFHLAAHISVADSMVNPAVCVDINITGTNVILQEAANSGVQKVVLTSSAAVYGDQKDLPIPETATLFPLSPYGVSKQVDEVLGGMYTRSFGLPTVALRYFNVYGPRQNPNSPYAAAIPIFIQKLLSKTPLMIHGDGKQTRDFVFVKDIARANLAAVETSAGDGKVINICSGNPISISDLVEILRNLIPGTPEPEYVAARAGDIYQSFGDPNLAKKLLNYQVDVDLASGLQETIDWMKR